MSKVIFLFEGIEFIIQCIKDEKMKDICQRYAKEIDRNINSLLFLYEGKPINFNLKFNEQVNIIDKEKKEMKILVYKNEDNKNICLNYGEKKNENINNYIISELIINEGDINENIRIINSYEEFMRIIKYNDIKNELKNEDEIKKCEIKINYGTFIGEILNTELNNDKINYIISEIYIKDEDVNKNIRIINSYEEHLRDIKCAIIIDPKYNNEEEIKKCEIKINDELIPFNYFYKFKSKGKYIIKYIFKNNIKNLCLIFSDCESIKNIDLSNFNTNNVTNMRYMFSR